MSMLEVTMGGTHLEKLRELSRVIAAQIDSGGDKHSMAQLARQYRETEREIAELEAQQETETDEIGALIADHNAR